MLRNLTNKVYAISTDLLKKANLVNINEDIEGEFTPIQKKEEGEVVTLRISGVLESQLSFLSWLFGGSSTYDIQKEIEILAKDNSISKVILDIDSPGGDISGIQAVANSIYENREKFVAYVHDNSYSAACWIASACSQVILASETAGIGSIGVVMIHQDISQLEEKIGIKTTEIYSGKYKRIASNHKPLSEEGLETLQKQTDYFYSIFVKDIAKFRGKTEENVIQYMAEGKIFIGQQAIECGLADAISYNVYNYIGKNMDKNITLSELQEKNPQLCEEIKKQGFNEGFQKGINEERTRILGIQQLAGGSGSQKMLVKAIAEGYSIEKTGFELWQENKAKLDIQNNAKFFAEENKIVPKNPEEEEEEEEKKEEKKEEAKVLAYMLGGKK